MKKETNRVLAYRLATTIKESEISSIAGGSANISSQQTLKASGNSAQGPDVFYDRTVDF